MINSAQKFLSSDFIVWTDFLSIRCCWLSTDGGFPDFPRFAMVFGPLVLRAQGELEARKTCVVKPLSRSSRKIKHFEKIFSEKKVTTDSFRTNFDNFRKFRLHHPNNRDSGDILYESTYLMRHSVLWESHRICI